MSKITIKNIREAFPNYTNYEQQGSKQLFICSDYSKPGNYRKILVSYLTIVGRYNYVLDEWKLTKQRYSVTTSRQLNQFAKSENVTWVSSHV